MSMLEFPTFEQMVATMNDPVAPQMAMPLDGNMNGMEMPEMDSDDEAAMEMEMSTDDMIAAMYGMMKSMHETTAYGSGNVSTIGGNPDVQNTAENLPLMLMGG